MHPADDELCVVEAFMYNTGACALWLISSQP